MVISSILSQLSAESYSLRPSRSLDEMCFVRAGVCSRKTNAMYSETGWFVVVTKTNCFNARRDK